MKYIEKLLEGIKVEWATLGDDSFVEIANSGRKPVKGSLRIAGETPYYGANNIQDYVEGYTHNGEFVLIAEDGAVNIENYSIQYAVGKFWANNHVHVIGGKKGLITRFLFYYLQVVNFIPFLSGGSRAKLTKANLVDIPIPIPPLRVQQEIVRILDTFTRLIAELTAELTARKKQYAYYREQLLTFKEGEVEWKRLGEICINISSGKNIKREENGIYPIYGSTGIIGKTNYPTFNYEQILVARVGTAGYVHIAQGQYDVSDNALIVQNNNSIILKFLYHLLVDMNLNQFAKGATQPLITATQLKALVLPIPPLRVQQKIVRILDKFDTLTTSISEGLPREIELRKKQYAYYREQLLDFPGKKEMNK